MNTTFQRIAVTQTTRYRVEFVADTVFGCLRANSGHTGGLTNPCPSVENAWPVIVSTGGPPLASEENTKISSVTYFTSSLPFG